MPIPVSGINTLLKMGDGESPEVFTTIAEVRSISGPSISVDTVETVSHSATGPWKTFMPTLIDAGEVSFDISYNPSDSTHADLYAKITGRVRTNFKLEFPMSPVKTWAFAGYVTNLEQEFPVDDVITASVTIKLDGEPTLS